MFNTLAYFYLRPNSYSDVSAYRIKLQLISQFYQIKLSLNSYREKKMSEIKCKVLAVKKGGD